MGILAVYVVSILSVSATTFAQVNSSPARKRASLSLGSIPSFLPNGEVSTCSQLGLAAQNRDKYLEISDSLRSVTKNSDCSMTKVVGVCETQTVADSAVIIYTDIYYYDSAYNKGSAEAVCKSAGGQFLFL